MTACDWQDIGSRVKPYDDVFDDDDDVYYDDDVFYNDYDVFDDWWVGCLLYTWSCIYLEVR